MAVLAQTTMISTLLPLVLLCLWVGCSLSSQPSHPRALGVKMQSCALLFPCVEPTGLCKAVKRWVQSRWHLLDLVGRPG
jgi:hypothetical protein